MYVCVYVCVGKKGGIILGSFLQAQKPGSLGRVEPFYKGCGVVSEQGCPDYGGVE